MEFEIELLDRPYQFSDVPDWDIFYQGGSVHIKLPEHMADETSNAVNLITKEEEFIQSATLIRRVKQPIRVEVEE